MVGDLEPIPFGKAHVVLEGTELTVVAIRPLVILSLEAGKRADLVAPDDDPYTPPGEDLRHAVPARAMVGAARV